VGASIHSPTADALGSIQVLQDSTGIEKAASRVEAPLLRGNDAEAAITERSGLTISLQRERWNEASESRSERQKCSVEKIIHDEQTMRSFISQKRTFKRYWTRRTWIVRLGVQENQVNDLQTPLVIPNCWLWGLKSAERAQIGAASYV